MTQPSSTLNTGLSFQTDVSARLCLCTTKPVWFSLSSWSNMSPLEKSHRPLWGCFGVDIRVHPSAISIVSTPLPVTSRCPVYLHSNLSRCPCSRYSSVKILWSNWSFLFPVAGELNVDDDSRAVTKSPADAAFAWLLSVLNYCPRL